MLDDLFGTKELAEILEVHPRKVGQATAPMLEKIERLCARSPGRLLIMIGRQMLVREEMERQKRVQSAQCRVQSGLG